MYVPAIAPHLPNPNTNSVVSVPPIPIVKLCVVIAIQTALLAKVIATIARVASHSQILLIMVSSTTTSPIVQHACALVLPPLISSLLKGTMAVSKRWSAIHAPDSVLTVTLPIQ